MFLVQEYIPPCVCVCVFCVGVHMWVFVQESVCVCLFSHFPFFISHVCGFADSRAHLTRAEAWLRPTQTCGWRQWLRNEGKGRGEEREREGSQGGREQKQREVEGVIDGMPPPTAPPSPGVAEMSSWPWIHVWQRRSACTHAYTDLIQMQRTGAAENSKTEAFHNICQLSGRKQAWVQDQSSPSCGPGLEDGTDRNRKWEVRQRARCEKLSITDKGFYNKQTGSHCDGRMDQSVINT